MTINEKALLLHKQWQGKLETCAKTPVKSREDLALAYTPGVAEPCKVIAKDQEAAYTYTMKSNTVAVVSDGSAVLGLGNIGPYAAMPVMEGKAVLFKEFGGVNAVPICLDTQDTEEIIKAVTWMAPGFGGINLEDISAPRCFEIEERLKEILDIPVFHDDQHGTAIVVLAGIINALKVVGKEKEDCRVVVNGAGSAGIAISRLLLTYGFKNLILCDKSGILSETSEDLNWMQKKMTEVTNLNHETGSLADALKNADIFVGVSAPNIVTPEMVASMNKDAILFAMANPVPEIMPDVAKAAGARVVGTGRSDFPNQVNNVVAFPGIFKGALEGRASQITEEMKLAAALAIAGLVPEDELNENNIMPEAFNPQVAQVVAEAVKSPHPMNPVNWHGKPYYSLDAWCKNTYGEKCYKIALDAGFTCPNRDGTLGKGGCIFCSAGGSGDFAVKMKKHDISTQLQEGLRLFGDKKIGSRFIAYFQAYTNTYAPVETLRSIYEPALNEPSVCGISIATRPDCVGPKVCDLLKELKVKYPDKFIWVELGLQTIHEKTARFIRRGYELPCFEDAFFRLSKIGIPVIVHVILGLPEETADDIYETISYLNGLSPFGIKLQLLHILKGTDLAVYYEQHPFPVYDLEKYLEVLIGCIERLSPDITIHRLTGDGPKNLLIEPRFSLNKRLVLNSLHAALKQTDSYQGKHYQKKYGEFL